MGVHEKHDGGLAQALPALRRELQVLLESEAIGGAAACASSAPLRVSPDVSGDVGSLLSAIRAGEDIMGRSGTGPDWLDQVILGNREVVW